LGPSDDDSCFKKILTKEECSIEAHFCIKDDAMWVYVPKDGEEKTKGKKSKQTIMRSIQIDNNNILEVMNFQKYIKIYMKSSYCKTRHQNIWEDKKGN
jgi:hypothetical protein